MRLLVIEDDAKTAEFVRSALRGEGWSVDVAPDGTTAGRALAAAAYDTVVMDIMLPGQSGLELLREMRIRGSRTPVLLLSARGSVSERVEGLDAGADDYLAKPFAVEELRARVRALTRRGAEARPAVLRVADLSLDCATRMASRGGKVIELTTREYRLLEFLMRAEGRICPRMLILEKVWDYDFDPGSNIIDVYIRKLRDKIDSGFEPKLLHSVRGVGYVMKEAP